MEFEVLGPLQARDHETAVRLSPKLAGLLAALLCRPNVTVAEERLIDAVWGEEPPRSAVKSLQIYVHHLRQELGDPGRVERGAMSYRLIVRPGELDAGRFEQAVGDGRNALAEGDPERGVDLLRDALALWRGPAFSGHETMPLVREEAARLDQLRQTVMEERFEAELALGRHSGIIAELAALVAEYPFRERLRAQLMIAFYRLGRPTEALETYRQGREVLIGELGLEPGRELVRLEQAILTNDPSLDAPATVPRRRTEPGAGAAAEPPGFPVPAQLPPDIADFTGRGDLMAVLAERLAGAGAPGRPVAVTAIAGMGGVGKTALALHAAHAHAGAFPDGRLYVNLRGAEADPVDPAQALYGFLLALGVEGSAVPDSVDQRSALFRSRLADRRVLVVLDNAASEAQVRPLIPAGAGCAVLITARTPLTGLEGARLIDLDVFDPPQAVELLGRVAGADRVAAEPETAEEIVRLCGHAPLAVRIAGARLAGRPQWTLERLSRLLGDERRRLDVLAAGDLAVRASFALSYAGLAPATRRAFRLMGALEVTDVASWAAAALLDVSLDEAEHHIEALVDARLLDIAGTDTTGELRYRMHDLVRLFARERGEDEDTPEERRAALGRVLGAWLWLAEQATEYIPGPCYATMHGPAPRWPLPTAHAAALLIDPMAWFDAEAGHMATAVGHACALGLDDLAWDLAGCLEKYFDVRGRFDDWRFTHETAIAACRAAGNVLGEAVLRRGMADLITWTTPQAPGNAMAGMFDQGELVLDLFQSVGERRGMADALVMRTWGLISRGALRAAVESAEAALDLAESEDYLGGRARAYQVMAVAAYSDGKAAVAVTHLTRCLELARLLGNSRYEATAMQFLGAAQCEAGRVDRGRENLLGSLAMTRAIKDRYGEVFSLLYLARLHIRLGEPEALATAREAAGLSRRHGMNHHLADALGLVGEVLLDQGRVTEAVAELEESVRVWRTRGWPSFMVPVLRTLARAHQAAGDHEAARAALAEADALTTHPAEAGAD
ncbi:BTAD domain-containing putative transcriptional regulator [Nocardiopsis sediminis]|uniref:BTAD domain-containing putative transcriptional regulator n=1 Tax=Nocardiopsis sediminis TaxID=1778267 RepID=A0ABV8FJR2_9ACTN